MCTGQCFIYAFVQLWIQYCTVHDSKANNLACKFSNQVRATHYFYTGIECLELHFRLCCI